MLNTVDTYGEHEVGAGTVDVAIYFDHVTAYTISRVIGSDYIRVELFVVDYATTDDPHILWKYFQRKYRRLSRQSRGGIGREGYS